MISCTPAGIEDRHHHVDEMEFGLVRGGGGLGGVVVAHQREHAAVLRGAGEIGVAEDVAGAVDARALAVPHAEHAVELALAAQFGLLRAPERGGGEVLVDAGLELDVGGGELARRAHELLVEAAERRAAIAGDVARGVEAGARSRSFCISAGADQRLIPGDQDAVLGQIVFVVEADGSQRHAVALAMPRARNGAGTVAAHIGSRGRTQNRKTVRKAYTSSSCGQFRSG